MDFSWDAIASIVAVVVSALTTIATYNLRVSSRMLQDLVETVKEIQITQREHSVRLDYIEKNVYNKHAGGD